MKKTPAQLALEVANHLRGVHAERQKWQNKVIGKLEGIHSQYLEGVAFWKAKTRARKTSMAFKKDYKMGPLPKRHCFHPNFHTPTVNGVPWRPTPRGMVSLDDGLFIQVSSSI